ncbi:MAG TPA: tol-pal system protein YbgF [Thermohalobaculum sp.]|nr:tol-pal system protein YbgF [Thermohalobaculum sp.]
MTRYRPISAWRPLVLAAALALSSGTAAEAQDAVDNLRFRVSQLEAQIAALRGQAGGGASGAMLERLDRIEQEVRALTGEFEELSYRQRQVAEDARRRFGDIEFRLTELEGGDVSALEPPPPLGGEEEEAEQSPSAAVSISERDELDQAIADVEGGRYGQGADRLERFLRTYGNSPLRPEALYWLGESQLQLGDHQSAARSFLQAYNADLDAATAPRALYRLGVTLGRLGQTQDACLTLAEVPAQYPNAPSELLSDAAEEAELLLCG